MDLFAGLELLVEPGEDGFGIRMIVEVRNDPAVSAQIMIAQTVAHLS